MIVSDVSQLRSEVGSIVRTVGTLQSEVETLNSLRREQGLIKECVRRLVSFVLPDCQLMKQIIEVIDLSVDPLHKYVKSQYDAQNSIISVGINALKGWTGKTNSKVVYDSMKDPFTAEGLFEKVKAKPNIALIGVSTDGDVFGVFYNVAVDKEDDVFMDPNMFVFSFESHGRCDVPQRFVLKEWMKYRACVSFLKLEEKSDFFFCVFDQSALQIANETTIGYCYNLSKGFSGLSDSTLTGRTWKSRECHNGFWFSRLIALHLS